ncbi:hypothetical protein EDC04DRAFT_2613448 [Pisolithus marmoratus]|nr:hypothetical protein EDC04DRAFT_2613448 [Pisolithus marmoratus]
MKSCGVGGKNQIMNYAYLGSQYASKWVRNRFTFHWKPSQIVLAPAVTEKNLVDYLHDDTNIDFENVMTYHHGAIHGKEPPVIDSFAQQLEEMCYVGGKIRMRYHNAEFTYQLFAEIARKMSGLWTGEPQKEGINVKIFMELLIVIVPQTPGLAVMMEQTMDWIYKVVYHPYDVWMEKVQPLICDKQPLESSNFLLGMGIMAVKFEATDVVHC